jgi:hypothetical protein
METNEMKTYQRKSLTSNGDTKAKLETKKSSESIELKRQSKDVFRRSVFHNNQENNQFINELKQNSKENVEPEPLEMDDKPDLDILDDDLPESTIDSQQRTGNEKNENFQILGQIEEKEEPKEELKENKDEENQEAELKEEHVEEEKKEDANELDESNSDKLHESEPREALHNEYKDGALKEENIIKPPQDQIEKSMNKEIKEYFPTDNDSIDTATQSTNLTSRFKNKVYKKRKKNQKKRKLDPLKYREQNFNINGLIHSKMKEYNSLTDHSLKKFFCSPDKVRHMTKVGLISKKGIIIKNPEVFLRMKKSNQKYRQHLPKIMRKENQSEKNLLQRSTLSEQEVKNAFRARSTRAKKKLKGGLSPLGQLMLKENKMKIKRKNKTKKNRLRVSKRKFDYYIKKVENLYNIK